ncbi:MAG: hypothetical protein LBK99_13635 [Opitutaceae bacterium]|nr:hypothetical protein [Opitutaceae bacterium]
MEDGFQHRGEIGEKPGESDRIPGFKRHRPVCRQLRVEVSELQAGLLLDQGEDLGQRGRLLFEDVDVDGRPGEGFIREVVDRLGAEAVQAETRHQQNTARQPEADESRVRKREKSHIY